MRILMLAPSVPYPPNKGTATRNYNILKNLALRHDVGLLTFGDEAELAGAEALRQYCYQVDVIPRPTRSGARRVWSLASTPVPDLVLRLWSAEFVSRLASLLRQHRFDFVQIEALEMSHLWKKATDLLEPNVHRTPRVVLDAHNAEHVLQRRAWQIDSRKPGKWHGALYSFIQWQKLRRYEARCCARVDGVAVVSEADRRALGAVAGPLRTTVVPNGVDVDHFRAVSRSDSSAPPTMVFAGTMDFRPNVDAVVWFCEQILPRVRRRVQDARLLIVGPAPNGEVRRLASRPGVEVVGFVDDVRPVVGQAHAYVVPLRFGGGTRFKVLEAMAMGVPVVSTSLGCEGILVTPGEDVLVADAPDDFAEKTIRLLTDASLRKGLAQRSRHVAERLYDWHRIVPVLEEFYRQLEST
ncbi:MAG: glycosyltransferase [Chloroflexi bacterium]|nr:glycosyltransferase [Chloroflexota bacterium]